MKKILNIAQNVIIWRLTLMWGFIILCIIGCDRAARYEVLTIFFEGVPPIDGKYPDAVEPNIIIVNNADRPDTINFANQITEPDMHGQRFSSSHEFVKDCAQCHTSGFSSGKQNLKQDTPDLCYSCHEQIDDIDYNLHGPLNTGECLFCHDPHQSAYVKLQRAPQPQLCYRCHDQEDISLIPDHRRHLDGICTECHDPHGSYQPTLLRTVSQQDAGTKMD